MVSSSDFQKAVELIDKSNSILITTHTKPDGDACGSIAAICDVLAALGKKVEPLLLSEVPEWYGFLFADPPKILGRDISLQQLTEGQFAEFDLIIIVDTNSYSQLPKFEEYLKQNNKPVLVIDHHVTADGLGDIELIDTAAAATGLIIFDFLRYAGWLKPQKIVKSLFVAVATDTGWFHFPNTDSRVHRVCAELIDSGANPSQIHHDLYQNFSLQRFRLMVVMLETLELYFDGRYASQHLTQRDFGRTGASHKDTENLIDECQRISTVEAAALFVEAGDGRVRCSLRSRGTVDVRKIAQKFGGGGHTMAAGAYLDGTLDEVKKVVLGEFEKELVP